MKKWVVTYWDDEKDKEETKYFENYESAMTFKYKRERRYNRRVSVNLKGK